MLISQAFTFEISSAYQHSELKYPTQFMLYETFYLNQQLMVFDKYIADETWEEHFLSHQCFIKK